MDSKKIAIIIIGLCVLSIIVGIFDAVNISGERAGSEGSSKSGMSNLFSGGSKIALINLEGPITSESSKSLIGDSNSAEGAFTALKKALDDSSVKGVILRINSPGGTVAISQEIYNAVIRLRKNKPVVVSMGDVAASGGYYIASAADRIWADPGTLTGSIGVIFSTFDAQGFLNGKLGIKTNVIKSGKFKDIGSPYKPMTGDEKALLQNIISSTYQQFLNAVVEGRVNRADKYTVGKSNLTLKNLRKYADGRIFTGEMARTLGFVDQIGGAYEAEKGIKEMAKTKFHLKSTDIPIVQYNKPTGLGEMLFNSSESLFNNKGFSLLSAPMPFSSKYPHQPLLIWE